MSDFTPTKEQLSQQLLALHAASLDLVKEISLDTLLERIGEIARTLSEAQYAAVGVLNEKGSLERFIPLGMDPSQVDQISHPPLGLGLIGALMHSRETIMLTDLQDDPRSVGFPAFHPVMRSFLGVPIVFGDHILGQTR